MPTDSNTASNAAVNFASRSRIRNRKLSTRSPSCDRDGGDLNLTRCLGADRFERAVRREVARRGGLKPSLRIARNLFTALTDPAGVLAHRRGALERVRFLLIDRDHAGRCLAEVESLMTVSWTSSA
jgi:hypothetical protein